MVKALLDIAGITIDGSEPWDIQVHDDRLYSRLIRDQSLGLGEAYMEGWWDCAQVDEFIARLLRAGLEKKVREDWRLRLRILQALLFNMQSLRRSQIVAERHYNLGNDLFFSFLDDYCQYSCAYFEDTDDLGEAQKNKMALICGKLDLQSEDSVLDIGCGWGGFAKFAAERYGCDVTGVNISEPQLAHARVFCEGLPVRFLNQDYRLVDGAFDKVVSIGMFEHVGPGNFEVFMRTARRCLRDNGTFLLHTIGKNVSGHVCDPWITKYIFPNGVLPSAAQISRAAEGLFVIEDVHNLGPHYDRTLMAWNQNFQQNWPQIRPRYSERFKRMWEYYLLSSAGSFRARRIQLWQVAMTPARTGTPQPPHLRQLRRAEMP